MMIIAIDETGKVVDKQEPDSEPDPKPVTVVVR